MLINIKTKIWLTVLTIVLIFSYFTFFYFPSRQEQYILKNYTNEVQNIANTIRVGVEIAINDQNFKGIKHELEIVRNDPRLSFVSLIEEDTVWSKGGLDYLIRDTLLSAFPERVVMPKNSDTGDSIIVKRAELNIKLLNGMGAILVGFRTNEIIESNWQIRRVSLLISVIVFTIALLVGVWLSRNISRPVIALREAARKVGKGDFTQRVNSSSKDEIGELSNAFNNMVRDLEGNEALKKANLSLATLNKTLNTVIEDLKATQAQLVQSEKMASLGELTAGIAHEIQNPLNFVNIFSEVNAELIGELKREIEADNRSGIKFIVEDLERNTEKITSHGKRADAIVKGMLQHSRASTGLKESTDINDLAKEYIKLSYQGLRAKDKSFNADIVTDFDENIGKIDVISQDLGRALLNLYNNAFYAVNAKAKKSDDGYLASVLISSKKLNDKIELRVRDNGMGIPQKILNKIFQPFFTTKPTGQGTGLGLSLCFDIITKEHGGTIRVETVEGEGSEFIVQLPLKP